MTDNVPALVIPRWAKPYEIETTDGIFDLHGIQLGVEDNDRHNRPRWAEIQLYKYIDTNPDHREWDDEGNLLETESTYGKEMYFLHTMGHSVVYHTHKSRCKKGMEAVKEKFPELSEFRVDDLEPCAICRPIPLTDAPAGQMYHLEVLWHLTYQLPTAEKVIEALKRPTRSTCDTCHGRGCGMCDDKGFILGEKTLTRPAKQLLEQVKQRDPAFRRALQERVAL